jgi:hypothetical protein
MLDRLLQLGVLALVVVMGVSAVAQPVSQAAAAKAIQAAYVFSSQVRGYHRGPAAWIGHTPPPPSYCRTMSASEFARDEPTLLAPARQFRRASWTWRRAWKRSGTVSATNSTRKRRSMTRLT